MINEEYFGKPSEEIIKKAEENLDKAGITGYWRDMILNNAQSVYGAAENDLPENLWDMPGELYVYLTTD